MSMDDERWLHQLLFLHIEDCQIAFFDPHLKNLLYHEALLQLPALEVSPIYDFRQCIEDNHFILLNHLIRTSK